MPMPALSPVAGVAPASPIDARPGGHDTSRLVQPSQVPSMIRRIVLAAALSVLGTPTL